MAAPILIGVVAFFLLLLLLLILAATTHRRSALLAGARPSRGVPTPKNSLPLLGNALEVIRNRHRLHDWLLDTTLELGGVEGGAPATRSLTPRTWAFTTPLNPIYVVVSSPAALEHVLSAKGMGTYVKGPEFSARIGALLGRGIFNADGASWRWQRKLAAHLFSAARFREFVASAFAQSIDHVVDALEPYAAASAGACAAAPSVDLHALMYDLTLDTFARVGFGVELGMLEAAADEARRVVAAGASTGANNPNPKTTNASGREFARAFDEAQRLVNRRFWLPLWRLCELLTGDAARVKRDVRVVRAFAERIVRQRRALLDKEAALGTPGKTDDEGARPDLLTLFMRPGALASSAAARFDGDGDANTENNELTDAEVVDAVLNFIIASRDTTAQAASWAFYELMKHPDVEAKLLSEAEAVLGPLKETRTTTTGGGNEQQNNAAAASPHPTYDQLRSLKYARAVFLEVCRLHPSIPQDCKYCARQEGDVLPDGTPVPQGALLLYSPYVVCRLPSFWGDDAAEFRPERWLKGSGGGGGDGGAGAGGTEGFLSPSPYAFPAFNAGPRLCLGRGFAELEGAFALVELLRRYRLRPAAPSGLEGVTYEQSTSLPILGGLRVHVERRQAATVAA
jgi:cytochrome P450